MNDMVAATLRGERQWGCECGIDCLPWLKTLPNGCVSLVFFSPPYSDQRTYGMGFKRKGQAWVDWLRPIIVEAARVSKGLVVVNAASPVKGFKYRAEVEWLVADLMRLDGLVCGPSPYAWVKSENRDGALGNGQPGSGGKKYQRRDWEPLYSFALPDRLPDSKPGLWADNKAFGHSPQWTAGGEMSHRAVNGTRANEQKSAEYIVPEISNPGNVIRVPVGGGKMGSKRAHDSEAPMALGVAERFVCWFVEPDGIVCDPMCGSGTTIHAALAHGRRGIGCDIRPNQLEIIERRMATVTPQLAGMSAA